MEEKENITSFRTFNSNLRKRFDISLRKMASALNVSPSFLSAVESGLKPIPEEYIDQIASMFVLSEEETKELARTVYETNGFVIINNKSPLWQDVLDFKVDTYEQLQQEE